MFKNYFKTALRQLIKNKLFSIVNIVGLTTGLASIMSLSLLVYQYLTTDNIQHDISQLYYLKTKLPDGRQYTNTTFPLLGEIVRKCPEVESATHIQQWYFPWLKSTDREFQEHTEFVDSGYFNVFQFPFKFGNSRGAISDKYSIVLSEETALKFFGNSNPVGRLISADDSIQLTVTGVLRHVPGNSTIKPTVLLSTLLLEANPDFRNAADWYNGFAYNYLRLKKGSDLTLFDSKIAAIVAQHYSADRKNDKVLAIPFSKISEENGSLIRLIIKGSIGAGIFILLIILANLVNLNAAGLYSRAKEVAVRQMIGSSKKSIILQFCIENGMIVFLSAGIAWIIFTVLLLPQINDLIKDRFGEIALSLQADYPLILLFSGIGLLFSIIAASLPAWKLISLKLTDAVKGRLVSANYKSSPLRNLFITIQFVLAISLIAIAIIFNRQIGFMKKASPGFNQQDLAVVNLDLAFRDPKSAVSRFSSILNDLKNNPHVLSVSTNAVIPTAYWQNYNDYIDAKTKKDVYLRHVGADAGYFPTFQIPFIQGKNFDDALAASEKYSVVINRSAMNAFGWTNAIGKQIQSKGNPIIYTVIGVTEDFHYEDMQNQIGPTLHWYGGKQSLENSFLTVRTDPVYLKSVMQNLDQAFNGMPSRRSFSYQLMTEKMDKQYDLLNGILKITNCIALLTIVIAAMGMFGLVSLFASQRVKEIGIRKVLGASQASIIHLLSRDFLLLVALAIILASPIAWYIMHGWLQDFAYRISIQWWMFGLTGVLAILIAMLTVGIQAIKASVANPVRSLRTE
jgi:putative ABC transport system permease protein